MLASAPIITDIAQVSARDFVLTGDRPTGRLHLGHYAGSILSRLALQQVCPQTLLIADLQALTDNAGAPMKVAENVTEVALDYLACGIDPARTTICLQSGVPELAELTILLMNLVSVARLERNPTVRAEMASALPGSTTSSVGFMSYPVSQAADILGFGATVVPVGDDQLPLLELANDLAKAVNRLAENDALPTCRAMLSRASRLPGIDGQGKASKSRGNAIALASTDDEIRAAVRAMFTDPLHLRVSDPGHVEGNVVFAYLDAFDPDHGAVEDLKARYRAGGLGDGVCKARLTEVLTGLIAPIRARRGALSADLGHVRQVIADGTERSRETAARRLDDVRSAFGLKRRLEA